MKKYSIKNTYADALYWAMSTQTKDNTYHITKTQESILRKLIHYSRSNEKITYSNAIIAQHTFMGEETIRKAIPELTKKGYISTANIKISDNGEIKTRRTIFIKWDFIESVLNDIPKTDKTQEEINPNDESTLQELSGITTSSDTEELNLDSETNQNNPASNLVQATLEPYPIPKIVVTDEKLKWIRNITKNQNYQKEDVEIKGQDTLREMFYRETGVWKINKDSMENQYRIKLTHRGGSICSLYDNSKKNEIISINIKDFDYFLKLKGIEFRDVTQTIYNDIKMYGLTKAPLNH